jgi:hypothetical protein
MVLESYRNAFIKPSKWFTEDIEKIFFHFRQTVFFRAEGRLKDASFQPTAFRHKHLQET